MLFCIRSIMVVVCGFCYLPFLYASDTSGLESHIIPKPSSPIQVDIEVLNTPNAGEALKLNIVVTTMVAANNINAKVELPAGSQLLDGSLNWQGSLQKDEQIDIALTVKLPLSTADSVVASAAIGDFESAQFLARAIYQTESARVFHAATAAATTVKPRTVSRHGEAISEYELQ